MEETPRKRGFAAMAESNPDRLREVARRGGASTPADKRSFARNPEMAREAGRKGGMAARTKKADNV